MIQLIKNEMEKLLKSPVSYLLIIVTCAIIALYSVLLYSGFRDDEDTDVNWKAKLSSEISSMEEYIKDPTSDNGMVENAKFEIMIAEYKIENNIPPSDWRNYVVPLYIESRELEKSEDIEKYLSMITKDDWMAMCRLNDENTKDIMSNDETDSYRYKLNELDLLENKLRYQYNIKPTYKKEWKNDALVKYIANCRSILKSESFIAIKGDLLSDVEVEKLKNENQILLYKIKHNVADIAENSLGNLYANSFQLGIIVVLAGITIICYLITTEYSNGTLVKLLSYPFKRWKIISSKLIATIIFTVVITIVFVSTALAVGYIHFGFSDIPSYLTVQNGSVVELNYYIYLLLKVICILIQAIIYISIGLCLSVWFENIGVSMGITFIIALASPWVITYLSSNLEIGWMKYVPSASFDMGQFIENKYVAVGLSPEFSSLVNISVVTFMLWMGYHQFITEDV